MKQTIDAFGHIILSVIVTDRSVPGREQVVSATIQFVDNSRFIAREYIFFDTGRSKYSYQWMTADKELIHRWDNAHAVPFTTSPFHQHVGSEENVQPSEPMTLTQVLAFIAGRITSG